MTRPLPVPDEATAAFWAAAAEHVLTAARCRHCHAYTLPPDSVCPHCGCTDPDFDFTPVSGRGRVRSWTVIRQAFVPGFDDDVPFVLIDVELVEQSELRMVGRLLDGLSAQLFIGAPVCVRFEHIALGVSVPAFELHR